MQIKVTVSYQTAENPNETVDNAKCGCGTNETFDRAVGSAHQYNTQENMLCFLMFIMLCIIKLMHLY